MIHVYIIYIVSETAASAMAVKNNYHWPETAAAALPKGESLPFSFIANGDVAEVLAVRIVFEHSLIETAAFVGGERGGFRLQSGE